MKNLTLVSLAFVATACSNPNFEAEPKDCQEPSCGSTTVPEEKKASDAQQKTNVPAVDNSKQTETPPNSNGSGTTENNVTGSPSTSVPSTTQPSETATTKSCVVNGTQVAHAASQNFYSAASAADCNAIRQTRECSNGVLSGNASFTFASCSNSVGQAPTGSAYKWTVVQTNGVVGMVGNSCSHLPQAKAGNDCTAKNTSCVLNIQSWLVCK